LNSYKYPGGYSFFDTYRRALRLVNNPIDAMVESFAKFGDTYSVYTGFKRMILTQNPEFIEYVLKKNHRNYHKSRMVSQKLGRFIGQGLLTSNGPYWLQQRRLIQPGFHIQKIQRLHAIMKKTVDDFLLKFPAGNEVEIYPLMNRLSFEIVTRTLFDIDMPEQSSSDLGNFISDVQEFIIRDIRQPHLSWWFALSGEVKKSMRKAVNARTILRAIIAHRKSGTQKFNDLLDMLLEARYEDSGEPMSEAQILDEILILMIAGYETTANALSWTLYLLANHPDELEKLRQSTMEMSLEDTVRHPGLSAAINESMRLYPPAWVSDRVALEHDKFKEYSFPKGTIIVLFYYGLHRSEKYWSDASSFKPGRFGSTPDHGSRAGNASAAYYPFGAGPRLCIGNNFALAEMAIFLQSFVHQFEMQPTTTIPRINPLITLRPEKIKLRIRKREFQTPYNIFKM
jgi:cytochrome P450